MRYRYLYLFKTENADQPLHCAWSTVQLRQPTSQFNKMFTFIKTASRAAEHGKSAPPSALTVF